MHQTHTSLRILGAGTPTPTPTQFGSAYVVDVDGAKLMFNFGPTSTHQLVPSWLHPTEIDDLFFTHHHFDHDIDYPCFLLCRWDQSIGKENMLNVYGPTLTERITRGDLDAQDGIFGHDWKERVQDPLSLNTYESRGGKLHRRPPVVKLTAGRMAMACLSARYTFVTACAWMPRDASMSNTATWQSREATRHRVGDVDPQNSHHYCRSARLLDTSYEKMT